MSSKNAGQGQDMLYMLVGVCLLGATQADAGDPLDRASLTQLVEHLAAEIQDAEFLYEGQTKQLRLIDFSNCRRPLAAANKSMTLEDFSSTFQGRFAFRADNATHLSLGRQPAKADDPWQKEITCTLASKLSKRRLIPDRGGPINPDTTEPGGILSIMSEGHPLIFFALPRLLIEAKAKDATYRFVGWERVDGHRCLVVEFDLIRAKRPTRFWVDVERGGHPLKIERESDGALIMRIDQVEIGRFLDEKGKEVWFPTYGRSTSFMRGEGEGSPMAVNTMGIIDGSLKLNQGLPDERFTLDSGLSAEELAQVAAFAKRSNAPQRNADRSADALIAQAQARAQGPALEAGAPTRRPFWIRNGLGLSLAGAGVLSLVAAVVLRRRMGA